MKKFAIVCKTKENFEKIKNKYPKAWQEEYEFVWLESGDLCTGKEIAIMVFDESHAEKKEK